MFHNEERLQLKQEFDVEVWTKITAHVEAGLPGAKQSMSMEAGAKFASGCLWSSDQQTEEKHTIRVDYSKPCYVYQAKATFLKNRAPMELFSTSWVQSSTPLLQHEGLSVKDIARGHGYAT